MKEEDFAKKTIGEIEVKILKTFIEEVKCEIADRFEGQPSGDYFKTCMFRIGDSNDEFEMMIDYDRKVMNDLDCEKHFTQTFYLILHDAQIAFDPNYGAPVNNYSGLKKWNEIKDAIEKSLIEFVSDDKLEIKLLEKIIS